MGWSVGYDEKWKRDIGYGVPSICDHPKCKARIDRGLAYVCGGEPYGGDDGCGLYFCEKHLYFSEIGVHQRCQRCCDQKPPFKPTPDLLVWTQHKMMDPSWEQWRKENGMKKAKGTIFKCEAEGDVVFIEAVDKSAAEAKLNEVMGSIPASMLKWSTVAKLPKGEEFL